MSRSPSGNLLLRDGDGVLGTHTLEYRVRHYRGADVGDDEDELEDRAQSDARGGVGAGSGDRVGVISYRGVEDEVRGDRGDEGDHHQPVRQGGDLPGVPVRGA